MIKDADGNIVELHCTCDLESRGGNAPDGRRVRGTIHWVSAQQGLKCEVRLYDRLFTVPNPEDVPDGGDFIDRLNPSSLEVRHGFVEPYVADDPAGSRYQFERTGYFISDAEDSRPGALVFNRTVTLRDTWSKRAVDSKAAAKEPADTSARAAAAGESPPAHDPVAAVRARTRKGKEAERYDRYLGVEVPEVEADIVARDDSLAALLDTSLAGPAEAEALAKWLVNDVRRETKGAPFKLDGMAFARLVAMVETNKVPRGVGRRVLAEMLENGGEPAEIAARLVADRIDDEGQLGELVDRLLAEHQDKASALREGRDGLLGFFVGQAKKETGGKADPRVVQGLVRERLGL